MQRRHDNAQASALFHQSPPGRSTEGRFHEDGLPDDEGTGRDGFACGVVPVSRTSTSDEAVGRLVVTASPTGCCGLARRVRLGGERFGSSSGTASDPVDGGPADVGRACDGVNGATRSVDFTGGIGGSGGDTATTAAGGCTTEVSAGGGSEGTVAGGAGSTTRSSAGGVAGPTRRSAAAAPAATTAQATSASGRTARSRSVRGPTRGNDPMRSSGPKTMTDAERAPKLGRSRLGRLRSGIFTIRPFNRGRGRPVPTRRCFVGGCLWMGASDLEGMRPQMRGA